MNKQENIKIAENIVSSQSASSVALSHPGRSDKILSQQNSAHIQKIHNNLSVCFLTSHFWRIRACRDHTDSPCERKTTIATNFVLENELKKRERKIIYHSS